MIILKRLRSKQEVEKGASLFFLFFRSFLYFTWLISEGKKVNVLVLKPSFKVLSYLTWFLFAPTFSVRSSAGTAPWLERLPML